MSPSPALGAFSLDFALDHKSRPNLSAPQLAQAGPELGSLILPLLRFCFFFQYKGIFESYLTDSIKLTPNDKPKQSCC